MSFTSERTRGYHQGSSNASSFCSLSSSAFVGMATLVLCKARASFTGSWCLCRRFTISRVEFHGVGLLLWPVRGGHCPLFQPVMRQLHFPDNWLGPVLTGAAGDEREGSQKSFMSSSS
ncbi:hypothetical protein MHYP_G00264250 [Metynnis hypsauchen]